jgi:hypothetical protein
MHDIRNIRRVPLPIIVASCDIQSGFGLALDRSDVEVPKNCVNRRVYLTTTTLSVARF